VDAKPVVPVPVSPPPPPSVIAPPVVDTSDHATMDLPRLSGREREVLVWFAQRQSCKFIAVRLWLSIKTVNTYRSRLLDKLSLTNTL